MFSLPLKDLISDFYFVFELKKARDMAATEARNYGNKARGVERRKIQNEELRRKNYIILKQKKISKYIIKTSRLYNKQIGFLLQNQQREQAFKQVDIHIRWQKMNKYGKLTIDVPQLVEKHRLLANEAWVVLLDEKVDFDFIDLISKRYDTNKKYSNLSKVVFKTLTDLSSLENKRRSKKSKNIIKNECIPTFYNDPVDFLSLLE